MVPSPKSENWAFFWHVREKMSLIFYLLCIFTPPFKPLKVSWQLKSTNKKVKMDYNHQSLKLDAGQKTSSVKGKTEVYIIC